MHDEVGLMETVPGAGHTQVDSCPSYQKDIDQSLIIVEAIHELNQIKNTSGLKPGASTS